MNVSTHAAPSNAQVHCQGNDSLDVSVHVSRFISAAERAHLESLGLVLPKADSIFDGAGVREHCALLHGANIKALGALSFLDSMQVNQPPVKR